MSRLILTFLLIVSGIFMAIGIQHIQTYQMDYWMWWVFALISCTAGQFAISAFERETVTLALSTLLQDSHAKHLNKDKPDE